MKKLSVNSILNVLAAVLLLVSLIVIEISFHTAQGWFDTNKNPVLISLAAVGILLLGAVIVINILGVGSENKVLSVIKTVFSAGACACAGVIFGLVLGAIATEFAYTFFSDFNKGTVKEYFMPQACTQAVAGMILSVAAIAAAAAANGFEARK